MVWKSLDINMTLDWLFIAKKNMMNCLNLFKSTYFLQ